MRMLVVLGEGGHTRQMIRLLDELGPGYEIHYLIAAEDQLSESKIRVPGPVWRAGRPRNKVGGETDSPFVSARQTAISLAQLWPIVRQIRPDVVLANGPAIAVPAIVIGKALGAQVIYVESASRVTGLSASGRMIYRLADLFIVQWPQLTARYPRAIYAGRLV